MIGLTGEKVKQNIADWVRCFKILKFCSPTIRSLSLLWSVEFDFSQSLLMFLFFSLFFHSKKGAGAVGANCKALFWMLNYGRSGAGATPFFHECQGGGAIGFI